MSQEPWEIVATGVGASGTTLLVLRPEADGFRLRDRCPDGVTPDGSAIDSLFPCRVSAMLGAFSLVDLWVK